jgi:DNA-binding transcriptional LysR family regulator
MKAQRPSDLAHLRLIEYAVALDQHRSFARAAQSMRVTQPTFSRGIAALEQRYEVRLFLRSSRRVEPTPEGTVFLRHAAALIAEAVHLRDALGDYRGLRSGRIVVGVGPYPLDISVIECVARLTTRHPLLQIELVEGQWRAFGPKLLSGVIEVAVVEASILAADPRFEVEALPPHPGCFYCRHGHPLAGVTGVTLAQILDYPSVGVRMPVRGFAAGKLRPKQLVLDPLTGDVVPHIATTSLAAARAIVKRTDGIGMAVPIQVAEDVRNGKLAILDADTRSFRSGYGIARLRDKKPSPGVLAFIDTLKAVEGEFTKLVDADIKRSTRKRRARRG